MGSPCTTNQTAFTDPSITPGDIVREYHINELKDAINREYVRRSKVNPDPGVNKQVGELVKREEFLSVVNKIDALLAYPWNSGIKTDPLIEAEHLRELQKNVNLEELRCLCNCNYCTCQCNYCTCDCNYCTCNCNYACVCDCNYTCACDCNYCTCNCNYACVCNCNYTSDIRLKTEIKYF